MKTSILSRNKILRAGLAILFWLLVWQGLAWWVGLGLLLPEPLTVGRTLLSLIRTPGFWSPIWFSLLGVLAGFLSGVVIGSLLAVFTWASPLADALFSPLLRLVRTAPVASFIILALIWLHTRTVPAVIAALMVIPVLGSSTKTALEETNPSLLEMAKVYRFSRFRKFRLIYLPQVLPQWTAACATAMGLAWKAGMAAEVIAQPSPAMGTNLYRSRLLLNTEGVFAWTVLIILLSFLLERVFLFAMTRLGRRYNP